MTASSRKRYKTTFVPWFAAIVLGATAHAGWLIHELRDHGAEPEREGEVLEASATAKVEIELRGASPELPTASTEAELAWGPPPRQRVRAGGCQQVLRPPEDGMDALDDTFAPWIEQRARYHYQVDRRLLDGLSVADFEVVDEPSAGDEFDWLLGPEGERAIIELRNIRAGTPLFALGLRSGDRVRYVSHWSGRVREGVEVGVERRGRAIELVYEVV
ncbi:hypothetical protein [Plesiocystis pacifica]|uniref:hypothetical protein n=1 Tax=Plesiocystis pacifica TaxID=191768 RepID=UPI0012F9ADAD|nr:hypothetical protein [Plesiocystis pacifica]